MQAVHGDELFKQRLSTGPREEPVGRSPGVGQKTLLDQIRPELAFPTMVFLTLAAIASANASHLSSSLAARVLAGVFELQR